MSVPANELLDESATATARDPRYPIGRSPAPDAATIVTAAEREQAIATLAALPEQLRNAVSGLSPHQLDTPYREGGWTIRQLVHHLADSHAVAFFRYKLALTEDWPLINVYPEAAFAQLHDYAAPVEWSLEILEATHARWVMLLQSLTETQWQRGFQHKQRGAVTLAANLLIYRWHSLHHTAHITHLRAAESW